jgi:hypothetical protein
MASHGYNKAKENSPVPPSALPLNSKPRQSMPVTNEHQPKLKFATGKRSPPRTDPKKFQCKSNGKIDFQPPLSDGSCDSPPVNANPCPSVTGIASNRQNYIHTASPFSRAIRKSFGMQSHGKMDFCTAARSPVVRSTRGQRQSMPVSNGHRLKPSKLHSHSFAFFQGHPKIIPHAITWKSGFFHRCSVTRRPIDPRSTPIHARQ